jgi:hypothetical protein
MSNIGKTQLILIFVALPDQVRGGRSHLSESWSLDAGNASAHGRQGSFELQLVPTSTGCDAVHDDHPD